MRVRVKILGCLALLSIQFGFVQHSRAEAQEVRVAKQFSMGYLQFNVMANQRLIEKHAKAMGLGEVKMTWVTFNGPSAMNTALLSGNADLVGGSVPGFLTLWSKTLGTPQEVRGVSALLRQPILLNTRNPQLKSIRDLTAGDRIALPGVKVSLHAVTLQKAAADMYGMEKFDTFDPLTLSLSPPDSTVGLLSGGGAFNTVFGVAPFQYQQLAQQGIRTILNSYDVWGPHTLTMAWTTKQFRDANPKLYAAIVAALTEATELINRDKRMAAEFWVTDSKSKLAVEEVARIIAMPEVAVTMAPENSMKFADFLYRVHRIEKKPDSWKDLFFPEVHHLKGS